MPEVPGVLDPYFSPPASLPFPAGESPFRQKGSAWLGDLDYLAEVVPGGIPALLASLDPALKAFVASPFRASDWYDVFPNPLMMLAAARLRRVSFIEHQKDVGRWHAKRGFGGIYRALLRFVSNQNVALWGPRISALYHEFGRFETQVAGPNEVRGVRRGVPRGLVQWLSVTSAAFSEEALCLAGARASKVEFTAVTEVGNQAGQAMFDLDVVITWT